MKQHDKKMERGFFLIKSRKAYATEKFKIVTDLTMKIKKMDRRYNSTEHFCQYPPKQLFHCWLTMKTKA